jgi:fluoroquinolone transport system permease protein
MTRVLNGIKFDMIAHFRNGIFIVYALISLIYIVVIRMASNGIKDDLSILILFSDPSFIGFFFIGAIILSEKLHKTMENLFITPLRVSEYIVSKTISLSFITVISSFAIVFFSYGLNFNPLLLFLGVLLSSFMFTLVGIALAVWVKSLNMYLWVSPLYVIIAFIPLLKFFGLYETPLFYIIPGEASLILIEAAFKDIELWKLLYAFSAQILMIIIVFQWARKAFYKHIILGIGGR